MMMLDVWVRQDGEVTRRNDKTDENHKYKNQTQVSTFGQYSINEERKTGLAQNSGDLECHSLNEEGRVVTVIATSCI